MRAILELPLAAALLVVAVALFHGGGVADGSLPWLGGLALLALLVLLATHGLPARWPVVLPLFALAGWLGASIFWSSLPSRSWEYANRALVYALLAALGLWLAPHTRRFALGLAALLGIVGVWALLGKVFPPLYDDYARAARLRGPVGLWNQLALLGDFALPLALWRRRLAGSLLAYVWIVALLLTLSRGGLATAVLVLVAWFALGRERLESLATLVSASVPAAAVVGVAFALPGITSDGQPAATRWRDGLVFGAMLLAGAVAAALLARLPAPRDTPTLRRALVVAGGALVVAVGALAITSAGSFDASGQVGNDTSRYTSAGSNFRTEWWSQAWRGFRAADPLVGTGAGTFRVANARYRDTYLDVTTEPHDLPLQFLSETGIAGLALLALALAALLSWSRRRQGHELALALLLPAYLVHALVDVDWDVLAVTAPALVAAGALAGGTPLRRVAVPAVVAATGTAAFLFGVLLMPWLGARWSSEALAAPPAQAERLADRAEAVDPLLVEPLWAKAFAAQRTPRRAFAFYVAAVDRQPENAQTWRLAGEFAFSQRCYRSAYTYLERYTELDPNGSPGSGGNDYRAALRQVDAGNGRC